MLSWLSQRLQRTHDKHNNLETEMLHILSSTSTTCTGPYFTVKLGLISRTGGKHTKMFNRETSQLSGKFQGGVGGF